MDETEKFYKLINDSALYPEFQEKNQIFFDFLPRKIKIGVTEINHGSNINDIDIDISELHEIVEDFYSLLRIFDIPPNLLFYKSMDDFLHNLKPMLGVQR
ncbi:hypothetical protein [Methanoregula sp.]|uniref:hypothetical protein n=1 Tax=Methanoregula sp. TaxID=2052170 RepID=UPI00236E2739|nr:hypothetical protein [Methanoregula sp.]MDD1685931.1 hypothetical protein [Methanoregula sp.]